MDDIKNIIKIKETDGYNKLYIINYSEIKNNCKKLNQDSYFKYCNKYKK